jgi:putative endonuclease
MSWSRLIAWWKRWRWRLPTSARTGQSGERAAAAFLRRKGYAIVARNWHSPRDRRDEIDLICRDGETLAFVEVKTRSAHALVSGYHAIDQRKKQALRRAIDDYLRHLPHGRRPAHFRFDVVEVETDAAGRLQTMHFVNVPLFPKHYRP